METILARKPKILIFRQIQDSFGRCSQLIEEMFTVSNAS